MSRCRAAAFALFGIVVTNARAAEVTGRLLSATQVGLRPALVDQLLQTTQLGYLRVRESGDEGPRFEGSLRVRVEPDGIDETQPNFEARLHEFYMTWRFEELDLSMGQRIRTWGITDVVNPNRFFGAKDNSLLLSNEADREVPIPQLGVNWTPNGGPWTWGLVYLPLFRADRSIIPSDLLPVGLTFTDNVAARDEGWGGGGGLRVGYVGDGFDVALLTFLGFDPRPEYEVRSITPTQLSTLYRKQAAVGLEASTSTGSWIFRAEGSYRHYFAESDRIPFLLGRAEGVFAVERPLGSSWRVLAQTITSWSDTSITSADVPVTDTTGARALIVFHEGLYRTTSDISFGGSLRVAFESEESPFLAELLGLGYLTEKDFLARLALGYKPWTGIKFLAGCDYLDGPTESFFGGLQNLTSVWLELSGEF